MKKSTLLSLLTAGAVIATSAGTFAAWDQTKGTATSEVLNFRAGVTTTVTAANFTETNAVIGEDPKFTSTPTIEVKNIPDSVDPTAYNIRFRHMLLIQLHMLMMQLKFQIRLLLRDTYHRLLPQLQIRRKSFLRPPMAR